MTIVTSEKSNKQLILLLEPVALQNGYELVDIDDTTEHGQRILRVFIDKEGGVTVDDCAQMSGFFEDVLDMTDSVSGRYVLEVSSPGLNRPLRVLTHFQKVVGQKVQIVLFDKLNGRKNFKGILKDVLEKDVTLEIDNADFVLPIDQIQKANVVYTFK